MSRNATHKAAPRVPIDLAEERARRGADSPLAEEIGRWCTRLVASVAARWRGHESEIAILATTTFVLAIAAAFAGADLLFTFMVAVAAGITILSPWRRPE
jgi:hypothetical protein